MTIMEVLTSLEMQKPNQFRREDKLKWLSDVEWRVRREIIDRHQGDVPEFSGYSEDSDPGTVLLVPPPYDDLYLKYLFAQIDFANAEMTRYQNSAAMFNVLFDDYARYYTATHLPLQQNRIKGVGECGCLR